MAVGAADRSTFLPLHLTGLRGMTAAGVHVSGGYRQPQDLGDATAYFSSLDAQ